MSSPTVVILEDDATVAGAIAAYFKKRGLEALITPRVEEARGWLKEHRIKLMVVDCLLPGESGVDFIQSIRKQYPAPVLDVILMSGVFTDPNFTKESIRSAQAIAFLKKPFDVSDLDQHLGNIQAAPERSSPRKSLYQVFSQYEASAREKRRVIESVEEMHGFDLPFIYSFLHHSKISGHLNIADSKGQVFGITFANGLIVGVDLADSDTFLGKLLIESGFILPEDLEQILNVQSSKRIGEKLISAQLLSPHGFEQVLANQMSIRMSRTILDEAVRINFVGSEVELTKPNVNGDLLMKFIHDWIASKVTLEWLKAHFTPYGDSIVTKGPEFRLGHPAFTWPLVSGLENLSDNIFVDSSLNDIFEKKKYEEETLVKALHFLCCAGIVVFRDRPQMRSFDDQKRHLRNVQQQFHGKNPVEIYELMVRMTTAPEANPTQVYQEFTHLLGQIPTDRALAAQYADVRRAAEGAYEAVKSGSHLKLKDELMKQEVEKKLKASTVFEQARGHLEKAQFNQALTLLERVERLDPKFDKIRLYIVWARLGMVDTKTNKNALFKIVDGDLLHVAPEDKFDALYLFVMGLYLKHKGEVAQAKRNFERAIAMDNSLLVARRELTIISAAKPKQDVFNQDLKTLVSGLFNKKK